MMLLITCLMLNIEIVFYIYMQIGRKKWKGDEFKRLFWKAVNAKNGVDYIEALDDIRAKNSETTIHFVKKRAC